MSLPAWIHAWDIFLLFLINQTWSAHWLDSVMARVSDFDTFRWPIIIGSVLTLIWGGFRGRLFLVLMAACLIIGSGLIANQIKHIAHRPRPLETEPHLRVVTVRGVTESVPTVTTKGNSFVSSHACNNVALAMVGCAIFSRWAWFLWPWAILVSYSRIYTGSHYPTDVLGGWVIGLAYTYFILKAASWLWRRYAPKCCPQLYHQHSLLFPLWEK